MQKIIYDPDAVVGEMHYAGDVMNVKMAIELAAEEGIGIADLEPAVATAGRASPWPWRMERIG